MRTDAVYQGGVFKPVTPVPFKENERVSLEIESVALQEAERWRDWLEKTERLREDLKAQYGTLPDSTLGIAEDRMR